MAKSVSYYKNWVEAHEADYLHVSRGGVTAVFWTLLIIGVFRTISAFLFDYGYSLWGWGYALLGAFILGVYFSHLARA